MTAELCTGGSAGPLPTVGVPPDVVELQGDLMDSGIRVILLGTAAGPYPAAGRQGCSSAVVIGDRVYLVDAGYGALRKYVQAGLRLRDLRAIFLTHLHSDHIADLFTLFLLGWGPANHGVDQTVRVFGPGPDPAHSAAGTEELIGHCLSGFGQDITVRMRTSERSPLDTLVLARDLSTPPDASMPVYEDDRVRVTTRAVPHPPLHLSLGFRFETDEGVIAFSGDTAYSDSVGELAAGADILVHETMEPDFYRGLGYSAQLLDFLTASHTSPQDVGRLASQAGAHCVALSHIGPPDPRAVSDDEWVRRVGTKFRGRTVVGHDLTQVIPASRHM